MTENAQPLQSNFTLFKKIWPFVKPYKWAMIGAFFALTTAAVSVLAIGLALRHFIDNDLQQTDADTMIDSAYLWVGIIFVLAISSYMRVTFISWLSEHVIADIRKQAFAKLLKTKPAFYEKTPISEILSRLTTDATILQTIIGSTGTMALRNILLLIGGTTILLVTNAKLTLYVFVITPIVVIPILFIARKVKALSKDEQEQLTGSSNIVNETLGALPTIQVYNAENKFYGWFETQVQQTKQAALNRVYMRAKLTVLVIFLGFGAIGAVFFIGGVDVISGSMTGGDLSSFTFYAAIVASSLAGISEVAGNLQRASASAERLLQLTNIHIAEADLKTDLKKTEGHIQFDHVSYAYPSRLDEPSLQNVSFEIQPGQTIAFIGPSGSGKSTILKLLLKLYDGYRGKIYLDEKDILPMDAETLRQPFTYVPQSPVILSKSLEENIFFGCEEKNAKRLKQAIEMAEVSQFIDKLPDGLKTDIGENGTRLSDGQKQRVALARAFYADPKILLLDEAMNALDSDNEIKILNRLNDHQKTKTVIIVTHRVSTIMHADQIFVMQEGSIIDQGNHKHLINNCALYRNLLKSTNSEKAVA